jgi:hypothetical protein
MKIILKAFKAVNEPLLCDQFLAGHGSVLKDYGVTNITSNTQKWMFNPSVYVVVAISENGEEVIGGIRIHIADGIEMLPVEKAIGKIDPNIHNIVSSYQSEGVGELCALWNAKKIAGLGVSMLLTYAGISLTNQINCKTLMGIGSDHTMEMFSKVGFTVDRSLGKNGDFVYPNENYIARVLGILNSKDLSTAEEYSREKMLNLRNHPIQECTEPTPKSDSIQVAYELLLK